MPAASDPLSVESLTSKATRLRSVAADHEVARASAKFAAPVLMAQAKFRAIAEDTAKAGNSIKTLFARGWSLLHLRTRLSLDETKTAANEVLAGSRPALEPLPPAEVATLSTQPEAPRRRIAARAA
jgi:hypothetical protein